MMAPHPLSRKRLRKLVAILTRRSQKLHRQRIVVALSTLLLELRLSARSVLDRRLRPLQEALPVFDHLEDPLVAFERIRATALLIASLPRPIFTP